MVAITALSLALLAALGSGGIGLWAMQRRIAAARARARDAEERAAAWAQAMDHCAGSTWLWLAPSGRPRAAGGDRPAGLGHMPDPHDWLAALAPAASERLAPPLIARETAETDWYGPYAGADGSRRYVAARDLPGPGAGRVLWAVAVEETAQAADRARDECALKAAMTVYLPLAVWARDGDGNLLAANAEFGRIVASDPDEAVAEGREILTTTPGESPRQLAFQAQAEGMAVSRDRHVVVGGQRRLLRLTETPLASPAGPAAFVGHAQDITDSAEIAAERDRHIAAHQDVLEHLATAIAIYGPDKRLLFFNSAYTRLWGLDSDWLAQAPTFGEVLEAQRARGKLPEQPDFAAYRRRCEALFTEAVERYEDTLHLPNMTTQYMIVTPHPFGGLLFTFEDVTYNVKLKSDLNTLLETQRESLDNLAEGIAVAGPDGRLRLTNSALIGQLGLASAAELKDSHYSQLLAAMRPSLAPPESADALGEALLASASERTSTDGRLTRADGQVLDYATVPLPDGAGMVRLLDVTDTVRIQAALRDREAALAEAERLKAELIANISYHLRSPLNALMGYTQMLEAGYGGGLSGDQRTYVATMKEAGRRLTRLIETVLDIAAVDAGRLPLRLGAVRARTVLADGLRAQRRRFRQAGLYLDTAGAERALPPVAGDRQRLALAVGELVANAISFTPGGGTVTLACSIGPPAADGRQRVALTVRDSGIGIPSDGPDVFARFARAHPEHGEAGPGLGLARARALIGLHGGEMAIASAEGAGTAVTAYLPVAASTDAAAAAQGPAAAPASVGTP